ncbi:MAG TPA: hypothetical protein VF701_22630, partial [Thermoanaerobaculia bacterium]
WVTVPGAKRQPDVMCARSHASDHRLPDDGHLVLIERLAERVKRSVHALILRSGSRQYAGRVTAVVRVRNGHRVG